MANLGQELLGRGFDVRVLTAQWQHDWSREIDYRGLPLVRLPNPRQRFWGTLRYMQTLGRYLRRNARPGDLVCVSMLKHGAYAAIGAVGGRVPVVLRAEGAGRTGDCLWQLEATFGKRIKDRCTKADALIGPSRSICEELIAAGYPRPRVCHVPNGVPIPAEPSAGRRAAARAALRPVNPAFHISESARAALYAGRLHQAKGLDYLVAAWSLVARQWPEARLWIAGDGPHRESLQEQIDARGLQGRVELVGTFDNPQDLLAAADVFVLPSLQEGLSIALLEAMAAGTPVVATDIAGNREALDADEHALIVPTQDPNRLASAIDRLFAERGLARRLAEAARQRAIREFSVTAMAEGHVAVFEDLWSRTKA
jgi:glycosyltransferase involved in cell wall biosynthesis